MSNGREIGTIVGSLVAAYFTGGASYAAFATAAGGAVGGVIGAAIDGPTKIQGQRLDDLKVQFSSYGAGIPILYGTERIAPNVIWSTDKLEISSTSTSGKGGGVENTSYKYYVHMRLLICETPRDGSEVKMVKIFQDGKLIWDASSGMPVGSALASAENPYAGFTLYQGGDDQLPDGREESWTGGPGTAPAYRGVVSVLMTAVECPGGRVPQFSFVASNSYSVSVEKSRLANAEKATNESAIALVGLDQTLHISEPSGSPYILVPTLIGNGYATSLPIVGLPARGDTCTPVNGTEFGAAFVARDAGDYSGLLVNYYNNPKWVELIDMQTGTATHLLDYVGTDQQHVLLGADLLVAKDPISGAYAIASGLDVSSGNVFATNPVVIYNGGANPLGTPIPGGFIASVAIYSGVLAILNLRDDHYYVRRYSVLTLAFIDEVDGPSMAGAINPQKSAIRFDSNGLFAWVVEATSAAVYAVGSAWELLCNDAETAIGEKEPDSPTTFYADRNVCVIGPSEADRSYDLIRFNVVDMDAVKAKDIIADQCERAGTLTYDVSGVPDDDTITGYKIANPASARGNIDPLLTCFSLYVVDEDGLTKFKKLSGLTATSSVSYDELGQAEQGGGSVDAMPLARTQEVDLPRSVTISYIDPTFDFQVASETEIRQVTDATEDQVLQLPLCINSDQAKRAAQWILFSRWRSQNTRSLNVSRKFSANSPGDGVAVEYPRGTVKLWRLMSVADTGGRCEWTVEPGDAELFTQTAMGAVEYQSQQVAPLPAPLNMVILDIPNLRDEDNTSGPYVALDSFAPVPASGELFIGPVGSAPSSLTSQGTVSASAPIGYAETALAGWTRNLVDETNLFTINIGDDVFDSCTRDVLLAGGGAVWALGAAGRWEIGSSALGDSLGDGRYILSRHLRGLFGTGHNAGTHAAGDTFVLLRPVGMLNPATGVGNVGQQLLYTPVAKGRSISSAVSQEYANTGEQLRPLSPVNPRRSTLSNDITLTVDRRSRLSMNNATGTVPLGEAVESYTWDFFTNGTYGVLAGSVTTSVPSVTVTSAQQSAWGLTPGATMYFRVAQNSDSVGAGHQLEATL